MIHGVGNKGNMNLLYYIVRKGIPWPLGAYENKRSFCSIDNITYVVEQLFVRNDVESGIYHICDDDVLSTNELIKLIGISVGKKAKIWKISKSVIVALAKLGGKLHLPLNEQRLQKLTDNYVVSNAKIKQALNIDNMPTLAIDGLIKTFKRFNNP